MLRILLTLLVAAAGLDGQSASFPDFTGWQIVDPSGHAMPYLNRPSLFLSGGVALMPAVDFADGTIDVDVALHGHQGFAGVMFRSTSNEDYELIYLRTHRSRQWDALQYTPIFAGQEAWQLYAGAGYSGAAELPPNRWVHIRVLVQGYLAQVFVDDAATPQLVVTDLKRPWARGRVGLWGRFGAANFSNVRVTPIESPTPVRRPAAAGEGVITRWSLSQSFVPSTVPADRIPDGIRWDGVESEGSGIVNIAMFRRPPAETTDGRATVYARAVLRAAEDQRVRLAFGYSDDVTVFLDGRPIFNGRNRYLLRDGSSLGTLTLGPDAVFLELAAGRHELVFAVTELFGGWGVGARLENARGVTVE